MMWRARFQRARSGDELEGPGAMPEVAGVDGCSEVRGELLREK